MLTSQFRNFSRVFRVDGRDRSGDPTSKITLGHASSEARAKRKRIEAKLFYCCAGAFFSWPAATHTHSISIRLWGFWRAGRGAPDPLQRCRQLREDGLEGRQLQFAATGSPSSPGAIR